MSKFAYIDRNTISMIFSNFNKLKKLTHGVQPVLIDWRYLCKALGDAQCKLRTEKDPVYECTQDTCLCADIKYKDRENRKDVNGDHYDGPCKHQIREMLLDPLLDVDQVLFKLIGADIPSNITLDKEIEL